MAAHRNGLSRRALNDGDRQLRRTAMRFGEELRELRLRYGVTQAETARAIGVTRSVICRLEQGDPSVSSRIRSRVAATLGADFRLAMYPAGSPLIHDAAHARLVEAILGRAHPAWRPTVEAPVPGAGRRSTDIRFARGNDVVLIEVETRIRAFEAIVRELSDKRSAVQAATGRSVRVQVVLALPPTRHHRALVRDHPKSVAAAFPMSSPELGRALADATAAWPGDGILWQGSGA